LLGVWDYGFRVLSFGFFEAQQYFHFWSCFK
jgi:hypothetical protein